MKHLLVWSVLALTACDTATHPVPEEKRAVIPAAPVPAPHTPAPPSIVGKLELLQGQLDWAKNRLPKERE